MYLCVILDLFSRKIVGYRVSRNASTNLVTSTFRTAFRERGNPREALIKSVAVDGERFFVKTRFEKRRNTVCTREVYARIRMAPLSPTAATYFSFFKPPDWRKRSVVRGRGFIQRFPNVPKQIRVSTHGENCGSWMSNPVFMSLAELHWQHWRCLAGWRGFTASMRSVRVA